jgi:phosphatidylglycerol lysyltransferase
MANALTPQPRRGAPPDPGPGERARLLALLARYGWNATSFQTLEPGLRYWFDGDDACVAYADTGGAWVVAGAPVAARERLGEVADRFVALARRRRKRACFFAVEPRFVEASGLAHLRVGEQPVWAPARWADALAASRGLREQLRRARAKGVRVRAASAAEAGDPSSPLRASLEALAARWLASRGMAPMGFLVALEPFSFAAERRYFVAELGGRPVAMLVAVPVYARRGWFFEDLVRDPEAPNGSAELLVDAAMRAASAEGSPYVTLGLAPLAGPLPRGLLLARAWGKALYDFEGVRAFKAKLRPAAWDPIYLAHPPGSSGAVALYDTLRAFARGGLLRFGLATLRRAWAGARRPALPPRPHPGR